MAYLEYPLAFEYSYDDFAEGTNNLSYNSKYDALNINKVIRGLL